MPQISVCFTSADAYEQNDKYALYLESAKFADQNGFHAVWTPERHFDTVGSLYPNPSLLCAALATVTDKVRLRAGSVVVPLHNPVRIAEKWSVVDNLSSGRIGIAVASGWHPRDFVLAQGGYKNRKEDLVSAVETIKRLWCGESIALMKHG